jgi:hypothetical protein
VPGKTSAKHICSKGQNQAKLNIYSEDTQSQGLMYDSIGKYCWSPRQYHHARPLEYTVNQLSCKELVVHRYSNPGKVIWPF